MFRGARWRSTLMEKRSVEKGFSTSESFSHIGRFLPYWNASSIWFSDSSTISSMS